MKKSNWHGGKGSTPRGHDQKKYTDNWDIIFGKKDDTTNKEQGVKNGANNKGTITGK